MFLIADYRKTVYFVANDGMRLTSVFSLNEMYFVLLKDYKCTSFCFDDIEAK